MKETGNKETRILVVDDHASTRTLISILLKQLGYDNVSVARDGTEALEKLRKETYGLILSDWDMPDTDGLTLWREIRKDAKLKGTPLIMVTAIKEIDMVKKALSEGISDYMVKPITLQALTQKVEKALSGKR